MIEVLKHDSDYDFAVLGFTKSNISLLTIYSPYSTHIYLLYIVIGLHMYLIRSDTVIELRFFLND